MKRNRIGRLKELLAVVLLAGLLAAGCSGARSGTETVPAAPPAATPPLESSIPVEEKAEEMELVGTLARTVEAGGWVLNTDKKTYLLLSIEKYRQEEWFGEGAKVRVTGEESPDTITIFMQGMPFRVKSMEPAER